MGMSMPAGVLVRTGEERATLIRRTYSVVFVSVLLTVAGATYGLSQPGLRQAILQHPFLSFLSFLGPLMLAMMVRDRFPANIALVMLGALAEGVILSPLLYMYNTRQPGVVGQAAILTVGAFGILTLYAFVSRRDFSAWGHFLSVGLWVLIGTMLLNMFFQNAGAELWLASVAVLLFSGLLVFDTWRLRNVYGPDDYVMAAVQIYLDLLNMFLGILRIVGVRRD